MKSELVDLIKYRLKKSKETLNDAKIIFEIASLTSTVNRIYYAMFYAVNGLLLSKNFSSSKHSGVRALLNDGQVDLKFLFPARIQGLLWILK